MCTGHLYLGCAVRVDALLKHVYCRPAAVAGVSIYVASAAGAYHPAGHQATQHALSPLPTTLNRGALEGVVLLVPLGGCTEATATWSGAGSGEIRKTSAPPLPPSLRVCCVLCADSKVVAWLMYHMCLCVCVCV